MVTVKITETFDMKTTVGKIGILGFHTPNIDLIRRLYPGLVKNYKFIRFKKLDVVGACASVLPADPLQVGVAAGDVAPEDLFNPILYKACTNESFDTLASRVMSATAVTGADVISKDETTFSSGAAFEIYYGLLSENNMFRKAMPQQGFKISNLIPIAHQLVSTYGDLVPPSVEQALINDSTVDVPDNLVDIPVANGIMDSSSTEQPYGRIFRGKSVRMPRQPLHYGVEAWDEIPNPTLVKTMVALMIIPPARLHEFYYRVRCSWYVSFEELTTTLLFGNNTAMRNAGQNSYAKSYTFSTSKENLDNEGTSIDSTDVEINKIMES